MRSRRVLAAVAVCGLAGAVGGFLYYRSRALATTAAIVKRLPTGNATVLHADVAALRGSGLLDKLAGSKVVEEPEYRAFVDRTGFDYRRDLDSATAAFAPDQVYVLLRGRFNREALQRYALSEGGQCDGDLCRMQGSRPERRISFRPLRGDVLALAAGRDPDAANTLARSPDSTRPVEIPSDPLWVSLSPAALRDFDKLPSGTRAFARAMQNAGAVRLSLAPAGSAFEARLMAVCGSDADAQAIVAHLTQTTDMLRKLISREGQKPNTADLSGVLTAGEFRQEGVRVHGRWSIQRAFLDNLLAGGAE